MPNSQPSNKSWSFKSIAGTVAVLSVISSPFISAMRSDRNLAYKDESGKPAICFGHTKNVKMTDSATDDQCRKYLEDDLTDAVSFVIGQTPDIVNYPNVFKAASHFIITSSKESYLESPMLANFKNGYWIEGCKSFANYDVEYRYNFRKPGSDCIKLEDGTWSCPVLSLKKTRENEMKLCLTPAIRSQS